MMTPLQVKQAWEALRSGEASRSDYTELYTLFTAALLHDNWSHLALNALSLWIFAGLVGELLGTRWMMVILVVAAICGSLGDLLLRWESDIPSLGASGIVMGFQGAYLGLAVRWSLPNPYIFPFSHPIEPIRLVLMAVIGFSLDITGTVSGAQGIAYGAHLGGFISGLFLTSFVIGRPAILQQSRSW